MADESATIVREAPAPTFDKTYRRADGEEIGDFGWVTDLDGYDEWDDEPREYIEETWERVAVRVFWNLPTTLYSCTIAPECDEDAVDWEQQPDGSWEQVCEEHRAGECLVTTQNQENAK